MAQYVMEFASGSVETALSLLDRLVHSKTSLQTLSHAEKGTLQYRHSEGEFAGLLPDLMAGRLCSVMFHSEGEIQIRPSDLPDVQWTTTVPVDGTIEFGVEEAWRPHWNQILKDPNVTAVCWEWRKALIWMTVP